MVSLSSGLILNISALQVEFLEDATAEKGRWLATTWA